MAKHKNDDLVKESYSERRKLFKNIWLKDPKSKEDDVKQSTKAKPIKTLRVDENTKATSTNKKKDKKLKKVCTKVLVICDKQKTLAKIPSNMEGEKIKKTKTKRIPKKSKQSESKETEKTGDTISFTPLSSESSKIKSHSLAPKKVKLSKKVNQTVMRLSVAPVNRREDTSASGKENKPLNKPMKRRKGNPSRGVESIKWHLRRSRHPYGNKETMRLNICKILNPWTQVFNFSY